MAVVPVISLCHVTKSTGLFSRRRTILSGVDGEFSPGESYAIVGVRGAGKTTLLNLMAGLSRPSTGRVIRRGPVCPPLSALALVAGHKTGRELAVFLAKLYSADPGHVLDSVLGHFGIGADRLDRPTNMMSPEDRAMLSLAIGYSIPADMYLFDGDIGSGDGAFRDRCRSAFEQRKETAGTVVATADAKKAAALARRGAVLDGGRLRLFDTVEEALDLFHAIEFASQRGGLTHARRVISLGESWRAATYLRGLLQDRSGSAESYLLLAEMALRGQRYDEAIEAAEAALREGIHDDRPILISAQAREAKGDFGGAVACLEEIEGDARVSEPVLTALARNLDKLGDTQRAGLAWKAIAVAFGNQVAFRKAQASFTKDEDWPALLDLAKAALERYPDDESFLLLQFQTLTKLRQWSELGPLVERTARTDATKAVSLIYDVARTDEWIRAIPLLALLTSVQLEEARPARVTSFLNAVLRRQAAKLRRDGLTSTADGVDAAAALLS